MDRSQFIICRAAAGSGKTYTLVKQYLALAFSANEEQLPQRFKRILAITFTNKAANEMKERILRELNNIAEQGADTSMGKDLAEETHLDSDTLRRYAAIVRQSILHNYSDFAVCTIDSFMHHIVRTFAHDLNLPMNFDLYIDNTDLIQNAVDSLMNLVGTDGQEDLTRVLYDFSVSRMEEGKSYAIESHLTQLAAEIFKEDAPQYLYALKDLSSAQFGEIAKQMRKENKDYERQLSLLGKEGVDCYLSHDLEIEDFFHGKNGAGNYFHNLSEGKMPAPNSYVCAYIEGDKLGCTKCSAQKQEALAEAKPQLIDIYNRITALQETEGRRYNTRKIMLKDIYALAVLNKMNELVDSYSKENGIVHISEFNKRISDVVQNEPTPFIYERIGNHYTNYLIDEFQDTSKMQWQNLVPLVENGVAGGHTSLVVGDGKQAIYRFRQGEVEQFVALPHVDNPIHGRLLETPEVACHSHLNRNFRTARTIVEFNNDFFEWAIRNRYDDNSTLKDIYLGSGDKADLIQTPVKEGGYVQVGFWSCDKEPEILWEEMLNDIHDLTENKGYAYRDITLLANKNKTLSEISTYLTANGIPVVSSESFLLTQSRVVMMLRSVLQYLNNPNDRPATARVLLYLKSLDKIASDHLDDFISHPQGSLDLDELLNGEGIPFQRQKLLGLDLYDCCEEMIRIFKIDSIETAYTATFLNVVAKYANSHRQHLGEFLEWFEKQQDKLSTSTANDMDAVRLMTIHKAKGLEAPIILYPILNSRNQQNKIWVRLNPEDQIQLPVSLVQPSKDSQTLFDEVCNDEMHKSDMDRINALYVALTRPKDKLLLYCQAPKTDNTIAHTSLLQDFLRQRQDTQEVRPGVFSIGENSCKETKESHDNAPTIVQLSRLSFPDWSNRIAIARQADLIVPLGNDSIRHGNLVHALLSSLHHTDDAEEALQTFLSNNRLDDKESKRLADTLHQMLSQKEVARFFSPAYECKNECDLVFHHEILRPDRIVYTPEEIWIVDFKTGMPKIEHRLQVAHYCEAIADMESASPSPRPVKGFLLYIGDKNCQVIDCK